jgi:hypothetical protein
MILWRNGRGTLMSARDAASRWGQAQRLQRSPSQWRAPTLIALVSLVVLVGMTACVPLKVPPEEAIVGQWVNDEGGTIYFYEDGTGFIPEVHGEAEDIPALAFEYSFDDDTHVKIDMGEQEGEQRIIVIEIKLVGSKMTWRNPATGTEYVYERQK